MDFTTRDTYRRAIEELARASGRDEQEVAEHATAAAKPASDRPTKGMATRSEKATRATISSPKAAVRSRKNWVAGFR